jgi:hypothetical protein
MQQGEPTRALQTLGLALPRRVVAYAVGGYALHLWNLLWGPCDADIVVPIWDDRVLLLETARRVGAEVEYDRRYGTHTVRLGGSKIDVFPPTLFGVEVTRGMMSRAGRPLRVGNLEVRPLSPPDLVFLKLVSYSRRGDPRDLDDSYRVLHLLPWAWTGVVAAAREQPSLAAHALSALLDLERVYRLRAPPWVAGGLSALSSASEKHLSA